MSQSDPREKRQQLEAAIAAQEGLRGVLDDAIIDATIAALKSELAALVPPAEQQRKLVTLLFMDVVGSTTLIRDLDPEDNLAIMDSALRQLAAPVEGRGGHIFRFMGDGFMAVFGYAATRENEPDYAVSAGLAVVEAAGVYAQEVEARWGITGFNVRVGISTGMVVIGGQTDMEFPLAGAAVNLAARMESAAAPGTVLISHDTYQHVRGVFDVEPREPLAVKGFAAPVPVYQVVGAKARSFRTRRRGVEGVETRMVGRMQELGRLQAIFREVADNSVRRMVTVVGDAGIGKSRLLYEFEQWVDLQMDEVTLYRGRARLETQNVPYGVIRDILTFRFGVQDDDPTQVVREKLVPSIQAVLGTNPQSAMQAQVIGQLLGYFPQETPSLASAATDARQVRDRALVYLTNVLKTVAEEGPVLILLEDLHWSDDTSLDFVARLALALREQPAMIVGAARPAHFERRPGWMAGHAFHERLELKTLSAADSRLLVNEVLRKAADVPEALRELVVRNAEGNPYYVEELIKMLIEDGVILKGEERWEIRAERLGAVQVPATLTGILQARLLALPEGERNLLQQASVVGRVFWDSVLDHLNRRDGSEPAADGIMDDLRSLREKEMVYRNELSAFADAEEHIFRHAILREVTYESVLRRVRRVYHGLVADWLIGRSVERTGEFKGVIADHLEHAGRTDEALAYFKEAAEAAAAAYANDEAVEFYGRALALLPAVALESRFRLLLARIKLLGLRGDRAAQARDLEAMEEVVPSLADQEAEIEFALEEASYAYDTGDYARAATAGERAVTMAGQTADRVRDIKGRRMLGLALTQQGVYGPAQKWLEEGLALARQSGDARGEGLVHNTLGPVASALGDYPQAQTHYEQALALARRAGDRYLEGAALNNLGNAFWSQGDYQEASNYYQQATGIAREIGDRQGEVIALINLGVIWADLGVHGRADEHHQRALALARDIGDRRTERISLGNVGSVALAVGEYGQARSYYDQALALARTIGDKHGEGYILDGLCAALLGLGETEKAAQIGLQAVALREAIGQRQLAIESRATLASVKLAMDDLAAAAAEVKEVLAFLESGGSLDGTTDPQGICLICVRVMRACGEVGWARLLDDAYARLQERAAKIRDDELRRSFLENVPGNRELAEMWRAYRAEASG